MSKRGWQTRDERERGEVAPEASGPREGADLAELQQATRSTRRREIYQQADEAAKREQHRELTRQAQKDNIRAGLTRFAQGLLIRRLTVAALAALFAFTVVAPTVSERSQGQQTGKTQR